MIVAVLAPTWVLTSVSILASGSTGQGVLFAKQNEPFKMSKRPGKNLFIIVEVSNGLMIPNEILGWQIYEIEAMDLRI